MRTLFNAVLLVISRAPQVAALLVGLGVVDLLLHGGAPTLSGLLVLAVALLGSLAIGLAVALPAVAAVATIPDPGARSR